MKNVILLCFFLLNSALFAGPLDPFLTWNGEPLPQENTGVANFINLVPNEFRTDYFHPVLCEKSGGVILSVGSFRALNAFVAGKCSDLIQFDYNFGAKTFNLTHLQIIQNSTDRFDYLAFLMTGTRNHPAIEKARKGETHPVEMIKEILGSQTEEPDLFALWTKEGIAFENSEAIAFLASIENGQKALNRTFQREMLVALKEIVKIKGFDTTFFGSDEKFTFLKNKVLEGHVKVIQGDIFHSEVFLPLGKILRANSKKISAFDVSNITSYIITQPAPLTSPERYAQMRANIECLSLEDDFRLLFTGGNDLFRREDELVAKYRRKYEIPLLTPNQKGAGWWHYYVTPFSGLSLLEKLYEDVHLHAGSDPRSLYFQSLLFKNIPVSAHDSGIQVLFELKN